MGYSLVGGISKLDCSKTIWMGHLVETMIENIFHDNLCDRSREKKISSDQGKGTDTSKQGPSVGKVHSEEETRRHQLWWCTPVVAALGAEVGRGCVWGHPGLQ